MPKTPLGFFLYSILSNLSLPVALPYVVAKTSGGKEVGKNLLSRLGVLPGLESATIWIHSSSVGESRISLRLSKELEKEEKTFILATTMTQTGQSILTKGGMKTTGFLPLDADLILLPLFRKARKLRTLILVEGEVWPNLIKWAKRRGKNVVIVNGRMTEKSLKAYRRIKKLLNPFSLVDLVLARTERDRLAFEDLGVRESIAVGNIKLDLASERKNPISRKGLGIPEDVPLVVVGSMREGEEGLFAGFIEAVRAKLGNVFFIVAPRHPERMNRGPFEKFNPSYRSKGITHPESSVLILDTMGELSRVYPLADVALVGGSFLPYGGHNIVEPISMGIPTVFGPNMDNFLDESRMFSEKNGGIMVKSVEEAIETVTELLKNEDMRSDMAKRGLDQLKKHRGSLKRTLEILRSKGYI